MRDWMKRTVILLLAVCMLSACAAGLAEESMHREIRNDSFDMEVLIGYDGAMTYGKAMPVRVRIRNFGEDFEGVLGMNAYISQKEYDRFEMNVAVPAGSAREFELSVSVYARQEQFTAEIVKDGEVICSASAKPARLVNPGAMLIGVLSTRPQNMNNLNIDRENDVLARYEMWQTVQLTPENFPESEGVLSSFGMLVLDDIDPSLLSEKQQGLLDTWLRSGRVLVCGGGANAARNSAFLNRYTGLKLEEITTSENLLEGLEELLNRSVSGRKVKGTIAQYSGVEPLARDPEGHGLIWRTAAGGGRIYTTAFEAGDPKLNSESLMHYFWQQLLVDQDQGVYSTMMYSGSDYASSAAVYGGWNTPIHAKSLLLPGLLITAGMPALGCVLWLILKKRDKRQGMWIILPVIAVLCSAGILLLAGKAETNRPMAVITENLIQDESGTIRNCVGISVAAPEFGRHKYSTAGEDLKVETYDYVDYDEEEDEKKRTEPDRLRTCYTTGGENAVTVDDEVPWEQHSLSAISAAQFRGQVEGEVWMEDDGLHGEIVNGTELHLGAGRLITSYGWQKVPALAPGEKAEIFLAKKTFTDPKNPRYEENGLYLENPSLYSVINNAVELDATRENGTAEDYTDRDLASSMISNASDALKRIRGNLSYGSYESSMFLYCAKPDDAVPMELKADGKPVEQKAYKIMLTADLPFATVGRTGVVFRSAGMDMPERVETDINLMPTDAAMPNGKNIYYHSLNEVPTFRFALDGIEGIQIKSLQVLMDSYYTTQARLYILNVKTREWEENKMNADVKDPDRYLDGEGRIYIQFRSDSQDMYADIPTPLINLEGRVDHAEN